MAARRIIPRPPPRFSHTLASVLPFASQSRTVQLALSVYDINLNGDYAHDHAPVTHNESE